jgi:hypothetical protein
MNQDLPPTGLLAQLLVGRLTPKRVAVSMALKDT